MKKQETYKQLLKQMIEKTEHNKIQSTDQLIQALIHEITHRKLFMDEHEH